MRNPMFKSADDARAVLASFSRHLPHVVAAAQATRAAEDDFVDTMRRTVEGMKAEREEVFFRELAKAARKKGESDA